MASEGRVRKAAPGGTLQVAVTTGSNVLWAIYRNTLSGAVAAVVPAHTRDAAFQLFCDLRANTPKDSKFVARHVRAFVPRTGPGWLALCSSLAYGLTGLLGLLSVTLGLSVAGIYTGLALLAVGGVVLSVVLSAAAVALFLTACCSGVFAAGALMSYASLSMTLAVMRYLLGLLFGPSPAPAPTAKQQPAAAAGSTEFPAPTQPPKALPADSASETIAAAPAPEPALAAAVAEAPLTALPASVEPVGSPPTPSTTPHLSSAVDSSIVTAAALPAGGSGPQGAAAPWDSPTDAAAVSAAPQPAASPPRRAGSPGVASPERSVAPLQGAKQDSAAELTFTSGASAAPPPSGKPAPGGSHTNGGRPPSPAGKEPPRRPLSPSAKGPMVLGNAQRGGGQNHVAQQAQQQELPALIRAVPAPLSPA